MTAPTPDQMRALADRMLATADWVRDEEPDLAEEMEDGVIALRAAADQVEAVRKLAGARASTAREVRDRGNERSWNDVLALLSADTAPQ